MSDPSPDPPLRVVPWPDEMIDTLGHDPRSTYVERFWLGVLGPSTTWLLRHIASELDGHPKGFDLHLAETAQRLGLGHRGGRHSPFTRTLGRLVHFDLAQPQGRELAVRRMVPPLNRRQLARLSPALQAEHQEWQDEQLRAARPDQVRRRASQLAATLLELGEDRETVEKQLLSWRFAPPVASQATARAFDEQRPTAQGIESASLTPPSLPPAHSDNGAPPRGRIHAVRPPRRTPLVRGDGFSGAVSRLAATTEGERNHADNIPKEAAQPESRFGPGDARGGPDIAM